jgi:sugar phosphate isomerase/epimerase
MHHTKTTNPSHVTRRDFCQRLAATATATMAASVGGELLPFSAASADEPATSSGAPSRKTRYLLASCMYGTFPLEKILPEVAKVGATHIDIWPRPHGDQREQIKALGRERFAQMMAEHQVKLGILTHYDLGAFRLQDEMRVASELGGSMLIAGSGGPKDLQGPELKAAVRKFVEKMKPHVAAAAELNLTIGIENHANSLIDSPDSIRWLGELSDSDHLGVALAPYHLPQDENLIAGLIEGLGPRLVHFYAWQHGMGCHKKLPKEQELLQMPGRGTLDFAPLMESLDKIQYAGWTEIFMHPVPRGIPILESVDEVTAEINHSRQYLNRL